MSVDEIICELLMAKSVEGRAWAARELGKKKDKSAMAALEVALRFGYGRDAEDALKALLDIDPQHGKQVMFRCLKHSWLDCRIVCVNMLGDLGDDKAVEPLIRLLANRSELLRVSAAKALKKLGDERWQEVVKGDNMDIARLGKHGDPRACDALVMALAHRDRDFRKAVVDALAEQRQTMWRELVKGDDEDFRRLARCKDTRALDALSEVFNFPIDDRDIPVVQALGDSKDERAVQPLLLGVANVSPLVRREAGLALARLGETKWVNIVKGDRKDFERLGSSGDLRCLEPIVDTIFHWYYGSEDATRSSAVKALGTLGDSRALWPLVKALADTSPKVRKSAAWALGQLGDPRAVRALLRLREDKSDKVRRTAQEALRNLRDSGASEDLRRARQHWWTQPIASHALGALDDTLDNVVKVLLEDQNEDERALAAKKLGEMGDSRALEPLLKALRDPVALVRKNAAISLGELRARDALKALEASLLEDQNPDVRKSCAEVLGKIGEFAAVETLRKALADNNPFVRKACADALCELGEPEWQAIVQGDKDDIDRLAATGDSTLVETFVRALEDTDRHHRRKAAMALGRLGNEKAVEALGTALLTDDDELVRASSARALGMIGGESALNLLEEALDDNHPLVRKAVREALEKLAGLGTKHR